MVLTVFSRLTLTIQTPIPVGFKRIWASLPPARLPTKSIGVGTTRPHIRPPPRPPGPSGLPSSDLPPVPGLQAVAPPGVAFAHVLTLSIAMRPPANSPALDSGLWPLDFSSLRPGRSALPRRPNIVFAAGRRFPDFGLETLDLGFPAHRPNLRLQTPIRASAPPNMDSVVPESGTVAVSMINPPTYPPSSLNV